MGAVEGKAEEQKEKSRNNRGTAEDHGTMEDQRRHMLDTLASTVHAIVYIRATDRAMNMTVNRAVHRAVYRAANRAVNRAVDRAANSHSEWIVHRTSNVNRAVNMGP
jgi:hypothetical protein